MNFKSVSLFIRHILKQLTWFDYLLGTFLLIGLVFFILFFSRENTFIDIIVKVTDPNVQYIDVRPLDEYVSSFSIGDVEFNELGQSVSEITHIDSYRKDDSRQVVYITMRVKANYNPRKKLYYVKGKPIIFGQSFAFSMTKVKFEGVIVDFPEFTGMFDQPREVIKVKAQLRNEERQFSDTYGVPPFIANAIKVGDEIKDSRGNVLIKVTNVESFPAKRTIVTPSNSSITILDQELRDVYYSLDVLVYKQNNRSFLYDFLPIYIGQTLPLQFSHISVLPVITDLPR